MLQPLQLADVSHRYASEIAELQDFLAKSGLPLETAHTLSAVTAQLEDSRTFRRDLTSHLLVIRHDREPEPTHSELLGMLALAAAGPTFAAAADDTDAHTLLRFLMQSRSASPTTTPSTRPVAAAPLVATPVLATPIPAAPIPAVPVIAAPFLTAPFLRHTHTHPETVPSFEIPEDTHDRRRLLWFGAAAASLLIALGVALSLHRSAPATNAPIAATASAPPQVLAENTAAPLLQPRSEEPTSAARRTPRTAPYSTLPEPRALPNPTAQAWRKPSPGTPMSSTPAAAPSRLRNHTASRAPSQPSNDVPAPVRVTLGNKTFPRTTASPNDNAAYDNPAYGNNDATAYSPTTSRPASRPLVHNLARPIVRPTSLGIMAANVTYSPAPVYPTAAAAAHVQGEVKLEAEVDRNGNVVSTRIVSGPPLLREAAADAVQRWLYRPYLYAGKPIAMNASVVMDFQLPAS